MRIIANAFEDLWKPAGIVLLVLLRLGLVSADGHAGDGFACRPITEQPSLNRPICDLQPTRLWKMATAKILP